MGVRGRGPRRGAGRPRGARGPARRAGDPASRGAHDRGHWALAHRRHARGDPRGARPRGAGHRGGDPRGRGGGRRASAMLSRGVAGLAGSTLVVNLPGSTGGVRDGLAVLEPVLPMPLSQAGAATTDVPLARHPPRRDPRRRGDACSTRCGGATSGSGTRCGRPTAGGWGSGRPRRPRGRWPGCGSVPSCGTTTARRGRPHAAVRHPLGGPARRADAPLRAGLGVAALVRRWLLGGRVRGRARHRADRTGARLRLRHGRPGPAPGRGQHPPRERREPGRGAQAGVPRRGSAGATTCTSTAPGATTGPSP